MAKQLRQGLMSSMITTPKHIGGEKQFLPNGLLTQMLDPDVIRDCVPDILPDLVDFIINRAPKIFAISVYNKFDIADLHDALRLCERYGLTDERLPICENNKDARCTLGTCGQIPDGQLCDHVQYLKIFKEEIWSAEREHFAKIQWSFLAPTFTFDQFEYAFDDKVVLPIVRSSSESQNGHFGAVREAYLHPSHLQGFPEGAENPCRIAAKWFFDRSARGGELSAESAWIAEKSVLRELHHHDHLIGGVAAFSHGTDYCIFSPWADGGNLETFLCENPNPQSDANLVMDVLVQLRGLADALRTLHDPNPTNSEAHSAISSLLRDTSRERSSGLEIVITQEVNAGQQTGTHSTSDGHNQEDYQMGGTADTEGITNSDTWPVNLDVFNWRHGDIKPANILICRLRNKLLGKLKIADLGLAKKHHVVTRHRSTPSSTTMGTQAYEAPEAVTGKMRPRSRKYDIWSFGCITLELIVWLLYGCDGLHKLWHIDINSSTRTIYYCTSETGSGLKAEVNGLVTRVIEAMLNNEPELTNSPKAILRQLLLLVRDKLLVVNVNDRMDAAELVQHLDGLVDEANQRRDSRNLWLGIDRSQHSFECIMRPFDLHGAQNFTHHSSSMALDVPRSRIGSGTLTPRLSPVNQQHTYRHEPLDVTWTLELDNEFAARISAIANCSSNLNDLSSTSVLCQQCVSLTEAMAKGYATYEVDLKSMSTECGLCELLMRAIPASSIQYFRKSQESFRLRKVGAKIVLDLASEAKRALSICAVPGTNLATVPKGVPISQPRLAAVNSTSHNELLLQWLSDCDDHHPTCQSSVYQSSLQSPTRLVKVGTQDAPHVRLVESTELRGSDPHPRYLALSYPWGERSAHRHYFTSRMNFDQHRHEISDSALPVLFRDAIQVTRNLGIEYLWIDALCIIQGPGGDFDREAERMENVFSSAYCVLASSRATGVSDGLLKERKERMTVDIPNSGLFLREDIDDFQHDVIDSHLNKRGWVLQERALARRTIYLAETQTYWECGQGVRCQTLTKMHNKQASFLGDANFPQLAEKDTKGGRISFFESLYEQYSHLDLSNELDRPLAIAGLERRLCRALGTDGGFGVFHSHLERSLLWRRAAPDVKALTKINFSATHEYVPSWSWMAYLGGIKFLDLPFAGIDWAHSEYRSPWAAARTAQTPRIRDRSSSRLEVIPRQFQPDRSRMEVVWDGDVALEGPMKCVVIGKLRAEAESPFQTHYVLFIRQSVPVGAWQRVGVGWLAKDKIESGMKDRFEILC